MVGRKTVTDWWDYWSEDEWKTKLTDCYFKIISSQCKVTESACSGVSLVFCSWFFFTGIQVSAMSGNSEGYKWIYTPFGSFRKFSFTMFYVPEWWSHIAFSSLEHFLRCVLFLEPFLCGTLNYGEYSASKFRDTCDFADTAVLKDDLYLFQRGKEKDVAGLDRQVA